MLFLSFSGKYEKIPFNKNLFDIFDNKLLDFILYYIKNFFYNKILILFNYFLDILILNIFLIIN